MKIKHKLILSFLLVATLASVTTLFTLQSYKDINGSVAQLTDDSTQMVKALNGLKQAALQIVSSTSELTLVHSESRRAGEKAPDDDEEMKQMIELGHGSFAESFATYAELVRVFEHDHAGTVENIRVSGAELIATSDAIIARTRAHTDDLAELREKFETDEIAFLNQVNLALDVESAEQTESAKNVHETIDVATQRTTIVTLLTFLLALFFGIYLSFLFARRIARLREASHRVGNGELEIELDIDSKDEVGDLSRAFHGMIGDLKDSRMQVESQGQRLVTIIGNVQGVVWETRTKIEAGELTLRLDFISDYIETMLGYTAEECLAKPGFWLEIVHPDDRMRTEQIVKGIFAGGTSGTVEFRWVAKDGREVWIESRNMIINDEEGKAAGLRGIAVDVTDRKSLEQQLTHQALHDPLTKLGNRVLFRDRVEHAINRTARKHSPIAVLFLDLDNFKSINDSLGHAAGDELLVSVTDRLKACLRASDTPARFGGDEFAILLEDLEHVDQASFIAERIRTLLRDPFSIAGTEVFIGSSIGIALAVDGRETPEELLRNADVAMYMSKSNGKDRYTVFENEMHDVLIKRIRLESDMRSAIDNREFEVYYQPILDLQSERVMGMEALVRWNHPEHGLIPPLDFIPLAEETGLIVPLGRWIMEAACIQARKWQTKHGYGENLSITVNVASRQFQDDSLADVVKQALVESKLPPKSLILEITESTMLADTESTIAKLNELKKLGIRFAIDDFGTGYSSLSYLQRFPVDILKIDKTFIDKLAVDKEGSAVTKAIITMSDTLNLTTIAEGVETQGQQSALQDLGCELGQGYHFARPLRAKAMSEFLRSSLKQDDTLPMVSMIANAIGEKAPLTV